MLKTRVPDSFKFLKQHIKVSSYYKDIQPESMSLQAEAHARIQKPPTIPSESMDSIPDADMSAES